MDRFRNGDKRYDSCGIPKWEFCVSRLVAKTSLIALLSVGYAGLCLCASASGAYDVAPGQGCASGRSSPTGAEIGFAAENSDLRRMEVQSRRQRRPTKEDAGSPAGSEYNSNGGYGGGGPRLGYPAEAWVAADAGWVSKV